MLKHSCRVYGIRPELVLAVTGTALPLLADHYTPVVVTSCMDSKHSSGSRHYIGCAVDFRIPTGVDMDQLEATVQTIQQHLGGDYTIFVEHGGSAPHIHMQYSPRDPYFG